VPVRSDSRCLVEDGERAKTVVTAAVSTQGQAIVIRAVSLILEGLVHAARVETNDVRTNQTPYIQPAATRSRETNGAGLEPSITHALVGKVTTVSNGVTTQALAKTRSRKGERASCRCPGPPGFSRRNVLMYCMARGEFPWQEHAPDKDKTRYRHGVVIRPHRIDTTPTSRICPDISRARLVDG